MKYKLSKMAGFVDKYGVRKGLALYLGFKLKKYTEISIPGISKPFFLRKDSSDIAIFDQVFLNGDYQFELSFIPNIIVDAGANIGLFTIAMKAKYPNATMVCIEPDKENFEMLQKNLSGYNNVELINAGLWSSNTNLTVVDKYDMGHSALIVQEDKANGSTPAVTIAHIMEAMQIDRIDMLKIDIETSEKELFSKDYEHWLPKVRVIIIELHDSMLDGCSKTFFEAVNKTFINYTYTICGENTIIENKDWVRSI